MFMIGFLGTLLSAVNGVVASSSLSSPPSPLSPDDFLYPSNVVITTLPIMSVPRTIYTDIDIPPEMRRNIKNFLLNTNTIHVNLDAEKSQNFLQTSNQENELANEYINTRPIIHNKEHQAFSSVTTVDEKIDSSVASNDLDVLAAKYGWLPSVRTPVTTDPKKCKLGRTMRVAIIQGGPLSEFTVLLRGMLLQLKQDHMLFDSYDVVNSKFDINEADAFRQMAHSSQGGCIEILYDGLYDGQWSDAIFVEKSLQLKRRIFEEGDVDMVWAMGSLAGSVFADSSLDVPVMVIGVSDPEAEGIIGKGEYSTKHNVHVMKEPERYVSMLSIFHSIFKFEQLGVIIDDSPEMQIAQAYPSVLRAARELNFNIVPCSGSIFAESHANQSNTIRRCFVELASKVDAIYLPIGHNQPDNFYQLLQPALDNQIPVFSQVGEWDVARGALLSFADSSWLKAARFEVNVLKQIYNDILPEHISQYIYMDYSLALNLESANTIGWIPDFATLAQVDKVFNLTIGKQVKHTVRVRRMADDFSFGSSYSAWH